ncbi:ATPase [Bacteroidia bacterium]|nr:ATPase [Bacteroidia bacterium]
MKTKIRRIDYEATLKSLKNKHLIKVITGIRRCGKSTLMEMFRDDLKLAGENTIYYNFEDAENVQFSDWKALYDEIMKRYLPQKQNYIFLDEIQQISDFERLVDALYVKPNTDIYITGSNAFLLSSALATLLSGRYFEINILPFSYKEYKAIFSANSLSDYMNLGGMPGAMDLLLDNETLALKYLNDVYNSVILQDVINYNKITNTQELFAVTRFAFDIVGNLLSPNSIAKYLKCENKNTDSRLIFKLLEALKDAFVLYESKRFDIKGKEQLKTLSKFYLVDLGFRRMLLGKPQFKDIGFLLENIVYFELLRRGGKIWTGKNDHTEVDFVVQMPKGEIEYYQVAWSVSNADTYQREITPLKNIKDNYKKIILTADHLDLDENGINVLNVEKWLLE